jgi:site-specific DNA-cytosine methylase
MKFSLRNCAGLKGSTLIEDFEIRHFHFFCGLGGGARGFNRGRVQIGAMRAKFRCIGGVDVDAAAIRDFSKLAGVAGTCIDLFDRSQYRDFHGFEPPSNWIEATADDVRKAAGYERPHIVFLSAPCKGFSGLLSESKSHSAKYQALNRLTLRGIWLMLEAWADNPPELIIFENVPRIASRGRALLDRIGELLRHYGYAVAESTHDCGEIGGLAQSRKRFLMVARHAAKVPAFLYEPPRRALRGVGEILGRMPMPSDPAAGPMHTLPTLQWKTWLRLAFVEAGSDWRSLNKLSVVDGKLADYLVVPEEWYGGVLGVLPWEAHSGAVTANAKPTTGAYSVADPRITDAGDYKPYGIREWDQPSGTVTGKAAAGAGVFSVADPRVAAGRFNNIYRVVRWDRSSEAVTAGNGPSAGGLAVADPRGGLNNDSGKYKITRWDRGSGAVIGGDDHGAYAVADPRAQGVFAGKGKYLVTGFDEPSNTVIAQSTTGHGSFAVADPRIADGRGGRIGVLPWERPAGTVAGESLPSNGAFSVADPRILNREKGDAYLTGGHYGVVPWESPSGAVSSAACHDNGRWSVSDPREPSEKLVCVIRALDGTWHRPFTTLELAALQSLVDPEEMFDLDGTSDSAKRERIGNAVPPMAAQAVAELMGETLLRSIAGESFALSALPVWVQPIAVALSVKTPTLSEGIA